MDDLTNININPNDGVMREWLPEACRSCDKLDWVTGECGLKRRTNVKAGYQSLLINCPLRNLPGFKDDGYILKEVANREQDNKQGGKLKCQTMKH